MPRTHRAPRPAVPCSTTRPCCITATRSAISATTPKSWVMNRTAVPLALLQVADQLQDLRLRRDVERGGRLVGDQQLRLERQRHGDHRALALAAGELMRIGPAPRPADRGCRTSAAASSTRARSPAFDSARVDREHLADLVADRPQRVERRHRLLEDHARSGAADARASRVVDAAQQVLALEQDRAAVDRTSSGSSRRIALAVIDLPEPLSPTTHRISFGCDRRATTSCERMRPVGAAGQRDA